MKDVTVTLTPNDIKPEDHPDFIGGWVWTKLEMRWIEERIAEAVATEREACAKVAEDSDHVVAGRGYYDQLGDADATARNITAAIRARGSNT